MFAQIIIDLLFLSNAWGKLIFWALESKIKFDCLSTKSKFELSLSPSCMNFYILFGQRDTHITGIHSFKFILWEDRNLGSIIHSFPWPCLSGNSGKSIGLCNFKSHNQFSMLTFLRNITFFIELKNCRVLNWKTNTVRDWKIYKVFVFLNFFLQKLLIFFYNFIVDKTIVLENILFIWNILFNMYT